LDNMYIVGHSTGADFPVQGALYPTPQGPKDGIIIKLCPTTPSVALSPNDTVVCAGGSIRLSADPTLSRYRWSTGESTSSIDVRSAGSYFYSADSPLGCTAFSDTVRISVRQKTQAVIRRRGKSTLCEGDSVLLYSEGRFEAYSWRDAAGLEIGTKDSIYVRRPGSYHLNIVDKSGCYDSSRSETITFSARPSLRYTVTRNGSPTQDTVTSDVTACSGDVISLTAQTGGLPLFWSTGSSTPTIEILSPIRIVATVTDASGCIWRMDTVRVDFRSPQALTVVGDDTACTGTPVTFRVTERPAATGLRWEVDGGRIISTADSGTVRVIWTTPGTKRLRTEGVIGGECRDTGVTSLYVRAGLQGGITASSRSACPGEPVRLSGPSGYASYRWNGASGDSVQQVSGPGTYDIEFSDASGCIGRDTVVITARSDRFVDAGRLSFDSVDNNAFLSKSVSAVEKNEEYVVQRAYVTVGTDFAVTSVTPAVGTTIGRGVRTTIDVLFQPMASGDRWDTLVCVFTKPCRDTLRIPLWGFGKGAPPARSVSLNLRDTSFSVFESSISVPLSGSILSGQALLRFDSLSWVMEYPATMLRFRAMSSGFAQEVVDGARGIAQLSGVVKDVAFTNTGSVLASITFTTLLGPRERDSVRLIAASVHPAAGTSVATNGASWTWTDVCNSGGTRQIGQGVGFVMSMRPEPADERLDVFVTVMEKGTYAMDLADVHGRIVLSEHLSMGFNETRETTVNVSGMPAGVYVLRLSGPAGNRARPLLIVHGE
ncbi:MAG: hypothetical protein ACKOBV_01125, partial [Candidatus Kapaibacterium sp.]